MYAFWGGGLVEAPHVVVHLWKALFHVILCTALPHSPKTEAQGGMVQLRKSWVEERVEMVVEVIKRERGGGDIMMGLILNSF